jgi:hypothetical protein
MLCVLSDPNDPVAGHICGELRLRGARLVVLNPPAEASARGLRVAVRPDDAWLRLADGTPIDPASISTVWLWRPGESASDKARALQRHGDPDVASYVALEWARLLGDVLHASERRWVPGPPDIVRRAESKLRQLQLASWLGFAIPETLITNDADAAIDFINRFAGAVIVKPPSVELARKTLPRGMARYTTALKPCDVAAIESIGHAPVMLQRRIGKRVELRVTVVGSRVFAAEIHSQATPHTAVDWRRYDEDHTPVLVHRLPDAVERRCVALTHALRLSYGAIDLILTPEGEYMFIEINPNGQFGWIEGHTGLPIAAALCDELLRDQPSAVRRSA